MPHKIDMFNCRSNIGSDTLKFDKYIDLSHIELTRRTVEACFADVQLTRKDIQSAHFGNGL
jgi:hypothetical protein